MSPAVERVHTGLGLQLLYTLEGKLPPLRAVPPPLRRRVRRRLTELAVANSLRRCPDTRVVAITGSMGKTTTKDLLAAMLATAAPTMMTRSNDNDVYGVPATLLLVRPRDGFAVVEVGVMNPGDMRWMASLFQPELVILTSIGRDHLESFGTVEAVMQEKRALVARLGKSGTAVVNADDDRAMSIARTHPGPVVTAGSSRTADFRITALKSNWPRGIEVELSIGSERHRVQTALLGRHRASQVALAVAAAVNLGVPVSDAVRAGETVHSRPGRLLPVPGPNGSQLLLDDHKARAPTVCAALATLAEVPARRRIAVLGELQDADHGPSDYAPVADAARGVADLVVAVGRAGSPLRATLGGDVELLFAERPSHAAEQLSPWLRERDVALICGALRQHALRIALRLWGEPIRCDVARCIFHWRCTDCPYLRTGPPPELVEAP